MTVWKKYGLFTTVSAALFVGVKYWFEEGSPIVYGQDLAECQAALNERRAATLYGEDAPWALVTTNSYVSSNATISVSVAATHVTVTGLVSWTVTPETLGDARAFTLAVNQGATPDYFEAFNYTLSVSGGEDHSTRLVAYNEGGRTNNAHSCTPLVLGQGDFTSEPGSGCLASPGTLGVTFACTAGAGDVTWAVSNVTEISVEYWSFKDGNERVGPYMLWADLWNVLSGFKELSAGYSGVYWLTDGAAFDAATAAGYGTVMTYGRGWAWEALEPSYPGPGYEVPTNVAYYAAATGAVEFAAGFRVTGACVSNAATPAWMKYAAAGEFIGGAAHTNVQGSEWWGALPEAGVAGHATEAWMKVDEEDVPFAPDGNWWTAAGLSTNRPWSYASAEWYGPGATGVVYNKWVSTNKLNAIRTAATNMVRTVCALGADGASEGTVSWTQWEGSTPFEGEYGTVAAAFAAAEFVQTNQTWSFTNAWGGATMASRDEWATLEETEAQTVTEVTGYTCDCAGYNGTSTGGLSAAEAYYQGNGSWARLSDVRLKYPAAWAVTNGLVGRVRVFGVFTHGPAESVEATTGKDYDLDYSGIGGVNPDLSDWYEESYSTSERALDQTGPKAYAEYDFATGFHACVLQDPPAGFKHTDEERWLWQTVGAQTLAEYPVSNVVVTLLHDTGTGGPVASLEALEFDFGVENVTPTNPAAGGWQSAGHATTAGETKSNYQLDVSDEVYGYLACSCAAAEECGYDCGTGVMTETYTESGAYNYYKAAHVIRFERFIVVVEWAFKHLAEDVYQPEVTNRPEWAE